MDSRLQTLASFERGVHISVHFTQCLLSTCYGGPIRSASAPVNWKIGATILDTPVYWPARASLLGGAYIHTIIFHQGNGPLPLHKPWDFPYATFLPYVCSILRKTLLNSFLSTFKPIEFEHGYSFWKNLPKHLDTSRAHQ